MEGVTRVESPREVQRHWPNGGGLCGRRALPRSPEPIDAGRQNSWPVAVRHLIVLENSEGSRSFAAEPEANRETGVKMLGNNHMTLSVSWKAAL